MSDPRGPSTVQRIGSSESRADGVARLRRILAAPPAETGARRRDPESAIAVSNTVAVNPPGEPLVLTREDVWRGLVLKAENALPFVMAPTKCTVLARSENAIVRTIELGGHELGERVTFEPQRQVRFERTSGPVLGTILNEIREDLDGNLELTFSFDLDTDGYAPGSADQRDYEATMTDDYLHGATATLAAVRRMITEDHPAARIVG